jgi:hypothetical protein
MNKNDVFRNRSGDSRGWGLLGAALAVMAVMALVLGGCSGDGGGGASTSAYTITFDSHGGSAVAAIKANAGASVPRPTDPTKNGFEFLGWFDGETGGTAYGWPHTLIADVTMHAQWHDTSKAQYTITFDSHEGSAVTAITADEGTPVQKPADPTRSGFEFLGWFDGASGGKAYIWPHTLAASVTMHAQWHDTSKAQYTMTLDSHGGSAVAAITVDEGTQVQKPADPEQSGFAFLGWFDGATGGKAYVWPYALNASVTMHAQWRDDRLGAVAVTVGFDGGPTVSGGDGAGNVISKTGAGGKPATVQLSAEGYTSPAWYVDGSGTAAGTEASITLAAADYDARVHSVSFTGTKDGTLFSKEITFTVVE